MKSALFFSLALATSALAPGAWASTGVCDSNPPTSTQACIDAIQNGGTVVNDIFKDANGLTGPQLPVFGKLYNQWPGCDGANYAGCAGTSNAPWDCAGAVGAYTCAAPANTFMEASKYASALDRKWWQPCRLTDHSLDINGCPKFSGCTADGVGGNYNPWEGLVFDLGGPSNKVAIFAENDHGPQPCESTEYTVYLTDNPNSKLPAIQDPKTTGVDPMKWNRAVLSTIYTKGFVEVRPPDPAGHAACGDTAQYAVEEDSFVSVYALPCGITFRYAAIVAGNDGLDFPACGFDSSEAELDAVAGLTESGAAVCPDKDGDHFVDCLCLGAPPVCDCNDSDPAVHPGAPEACDAPDLNCDKLPGACSDPKTVCYKSECLDTCGGENPICPAGASCAPTPSGNLCVPQDCTDGTCPAGGVCQDGVCVPACTTVVCPSGQVCQDGQCLDACQGVQCPAGQACKDGQCTFPCACFAGDTGCSSGNVCDKTGSATCVPPACVGVACPAGQVCNPINGVCADICNGVMCPVGQVCAPPGGCVPVCETKTCPTGLICNPQTGTCEDTSCANVTCFPPQMCVMGACVDSPSGAGGMGGMGGAMTASTTGSTSTGDGGAGGTSGDKGSCGCRVAGDPGADPRGAAAALVAAAAWIRRRRGVKKGW